VLRLGAFGLFCRRLADLIAADPKAAEQTARRMGEAYQHPVSEKGWLERLDRVATERGF
jgi:hypothetical protein